MHFFKVYCLLIIFKTTHIFSGQLAFLSFIDFNAFWIRAYSYSFNEMVALPLIP